MADDAEAPAGASEQPTRDDVSVTLMGNVLEKLRVLQYERELGKKLTTPYTETQFAGPTLSAGAQFKSFLELAGSLLRLCGQDLAVDKYDDPNTSVNKLILTLKAMGFPLDFPAARLKLGHGEAVCAALDFICDQALSARRFEWPRPQYPKEDFADEATVDEDAEVDAAAEDDVDGGPQDAQDAEELYSDLVGAATAVQEPDQLDQSFQQMIVSDVDPLRWQTELERVGPRLKLRMDGRAAGKEWHTHLSRSRTHESVLTELRPRATAQLRLLSTQLAETTARMGVKEKSVNNQQENARQEAQVLREKLAAAAERSKTAADRVHAMAAEHADTTERLRETKAVMDARGATMTDTSPLVHIKDALKTLAAETKHFELRLGVVGHALLQAKCRQAGAASARRRGREAASADGQSYQDPEYDPSDEDSS